MQPLKGITVVTLEHAIAAPFATRQLAKRQITWLRSMPGRVVVDAKAGDAVQRVKQAAMQALKAEKRF